MSQSSCMWETGSSPRTISSWCPSRPHIWTQVCGTKVARESIPSLPSGPKDSLSIQMIRIVDQRDDRLLNSSSMSTWVTPRNLELASKLVSVLKVCKRRGIRTAAGLEHVQEGPLQNVRYFSLSPISLRLSTLIWASRTNSALGRMVPNCNTEAVHEMSFQDSKEVVHLNLRAYLSLHLY